MISPSVRLPDLSFKCNAEVSDAPPVRLDYLLLFTGNLWSQHVHVHVHVQVQSTAAQRAVVEVIRLSSSSAFP